MAEWQYCALTDQGVRRQHNEDAVIALPHIGLWAVADGMGGHEAGDVASRMVIEELANVARPTSFSFFIDAVEDALRTVNDRLRQHAAETFAGRMMGSTVVSLLKSEGYGACLWAGDSRLYRLHQGQLQQVSRDHSQVQQLLDSGVLTAEQAEHHPNANVITRAVGGAEQLVVDVAMFEVAPADRFLLCSDGLYNEMSRARLAELLAQGSHEQAARLLLDEALAAGARDNVSLIVLSVTP